ncbi:MAG: hypothetical protein ABJB85_01805 [Nitrososphaerota archaeon]
MTEPVSIVSKSPANITENPILGRPQGTDSPFIPLGIEQNTKPVVISIS